MKAWIFKYLFEELIPFKWINGHKTDIARLAAFAFALMTLVAEFYPEHAILLTQGQSLLLTVLSLVGVEIGKEHKEVKSLK